MFLDRILACGIAPRSLIATLATLCLSSAAVAEAAWSDARQLVLVTTSGWDANRGTLRNYTMTDKGWQAVAPGIPVTIGRTGSAWGIGLHPPQSGGPTG